MSKDKTPSSRTHSTNGPKAMSSERSDNLMRETRHQFREDLVELEHQVLGGLDLVISQLDRAQESIAYQDVELA